jgi:hypothetical protein
MPLPDDIDPLAQRHAKMHNDQSSTAASAA